MARTRRSRQSQDRSQNLNADANNNQFQPLHQNSKSSGSVADLPESPAQNDIHSPFFLQSGDHPGLALVSHLLTGTNYNNWSRSMKMALNTKNKVGFIDGTLKQPASGDVTGSVWSRCNSMVTSWLLNAVVKEIANSLLYFETAEEVWNDLHDRFHQSNVPRIFQIKQQLMNLCQGSMDINNYFTKLKTLWDELKNFQPVPTCDCGGMQLWIDHLEQEYVIQFLMGLNYSYSGIRAQILMVDPLPTVSRVFHLLIQEERQRVIGMRSIIPNNPMSFSVSSEPMQA